MMTAVALAYAPTCAGGNPGSDPRSADARSSAELPIKITINPEARVSATLSGVLPSSPLCWAPVVVRVKVVNQGFLTARLEVELVGSPTPGVQLNFDPEPLKGVPEEVRNLMITIAAPGPTDLTLAFKAHNVGGDLGGRNRIHFLWHCVSR